MQPLYATLLSYPKQYATALSNRLWKWYATAYGNGMSYAVIRNVLHYHADLAFASRLWKWLANSPPIYRTVLGTVLDMQPC
jgi:hypothetical protein